MDNTNKSFIKIPNSLFTIPKNEYGEEMGSTIFKQIGTEGFTIWSYLLYTQGIQISAQTNVKRIIGFLNRNNNKNTSTKKSKDKSKNGLNDPRTIKKYLNILYKAKMIILEQFEDDEINNDTNNIPNNSYFTNIRSDEELFIQVNDMDDGNGFSIISSQLFFDYIHKIGHIGWSIYCLLFKNHNINFGNTDPDNEYMTGYANYGFANCSEEYISKILNRSRATISKYINKNKYIPNELVKIDVQGKVKYTNQRTDEEIEVYVPNHYIVHAKYEPENKYYIETKKN